ncbi:MAG: Crp/Fnr family transcriptional regulator [Lachnospiraceae bacterium]|nr:Crp/Fnr family transcriptional regulator [Lachnospiraceae bacterium]
MEFANYFPIYEKLTSEEQALLTKHARLHTFEKDTMLHNGSNDCLGLVLIKSGQLRAFITSEEGREITIYRLFDRDMCLFSASCMMNSIQFDISVTAEKDTEAWIIPADLYKKMMEQSAALANYTNQLMATKFTDVMWLIEQIMWKSMDSRLAAFLIEESTLADSTVLHMTHEKIASHLGTAREVITRMLKYFQSEGIVILTRGTIEILDLDRLDDIANP